MASLEAETFLWRRILEMSWFFNQTARSRSQRRIEF
jgi:hypothetical protein